MHFNLNYPFAIYPNGPMSEYNNYQLYRKEANRLLNFLQELNTNLKITYKEYDILILLMVGSTMEDVFVNGEFNDKHLFQYSQLFPSYINKFDQNTCKKKKINTNTCN